MGALVRTVGATYCEYFGPDITEPNDNNNRSNLLINI